MLAATEAYSMPSIVLTSQSHDGVRVFDGFREAYAWLSHNIEVDDSEFYLLYYHVSSCNFGLLCPYFDTTPFFL